MADPQTELPKSTAPSSLNGSSQKQPRKDKQALQKLIRKLKREQTSSPMVRFWRWTGIGEKKLWDIVQLLVSVSIPVVIFAGGQYFTSQNNEKQQKIADDKQKDEVLKNYFDNMKSLLLDKVLYFHNFGLFPHFGDHTTGSRCPLSNS